MVCAGNVDYPYMFKDFISYQCLWKLYKQKCWIEMYIYLYAPLYALYNGVYLVFVWRYFSHNLQIRRSPPASVFYF